MSEKAYIQPAGVFAAEPLGFNQVVTTPPGRLVFVSGQVAWDEQLQLVGGDDLAAQAEQALANLGRALEAAGATPHDLTMTRTFIVDYRPEHAGIVGPLFARFLGGAKPPASTLVGVIDAGYPAAPAAPLPPQWQQRGKLPQFREFSLSQNSSQWPATKSFSRSRNWPILERT